MLSVCDNNVYEAQTCNLFYYSTDKCTVRWRRGSTPKDGVNDPRRSLANKVPSHAVQQVNQEDLQLQHVSNCVKCIITSKYSNSMFI